MSHGHNLDFRLDWCEWCGRPRTEIIDFNLSECNGEVGRVHPRFFEAQQRAAAMFDPICDKIAEDFGMHRKSETAQ